MKKLCTKSIVLALILFLPCGAMNAPEYDASVYAAAKTLMQLHDDKQQGDQSAPQFYSTKESTLFVAYCLEQFTTAPVQSYKDILLQKNFLGLTALEYAAANDDMLAVVKILSYADVYVEQREYFIKIASQFGNQRCVGEYQRDIALLNTWVQYVGSLAVTCGNVETGNKILTWQSHQKTLATKRKLKGKRGPGKRARTQRSTNKKKSSEQL